ncbi:AMSH-like ubiquitin thioesterase 1 [Camellia lanceoleosa]|uniref:AMSH-like ubiquitin thioesterase 1 n=1 Tax=Camellia lanceoleosa TaxID=1840588 RepID=A0ACC0FB59_9ERIC|nr:AMSH-like ubiquitin thioesterase 1 [Camellia lanceoleosa]
MEKPIEIRIKIINPLLLADSNDFLASPLVNETIPCHREYRAFPQTNKSYLKKRLLNAMGELETLKPKVQKVATLILSDGHFVMAVVQTPRLAAQEYVYQGSRPQQYSLAAGRRAISRLVCCIAIGCL